MKDFTNEIKAYALKNALEFEKANASKILPKLFQHGLEKSEIKNIMPKIQEIVSQINSLEKAEVEREFSKYSSFIPEKEEKEHTLPPLPNAIEGKVITRLPPEPSKYLHLGHAMSFLFNYLYAERYKGKCLLRFEDTNPEKVTKEFIDSIKDDIDNYLKIKYSQIKFVSDDMPQLYSYAEKLIELEKAYVCFCDRETMQKLRHSGKECECRKNSKTKNLEEWKKFLSGKYMKGEAVLRIKGDMKSQNHVMRDSVIFRAVETPHYKYKDKYKVWPMYDFYNPIEDSLMGITHILRSNEFDMRVELQNYIKDLLKLSKQTVVQYGRINVIDATTQGREIRELISSGEFIGWDDPRLVTLKALKRRGITTEAIYRLANQMGLSKKQVNLDFDMIAAINRKILDEKADRYFFVPNPIEIKIKNAPKIKSVEIPIHPNKKKTRKLEIIEKIFISSDDYSENIGKEIRLLHLFNIKIDKNKKEAEYTSKENKDIKKIQWVSKSIKTKVLDEKANWIEGLAEENIKNLKMGDIIQFERFGFCRLDKIQKDQIQFWFSHK